MIRLEHIAIEKRPIEVDEKGKPKRWHWVVVVDKGDIASCDTEEEAEAFVGAVRLKTAVLNNFTFKRPRP